MNPFQRLGKRISDWWHGNITNGIMSLNSSNFLDWMRIGNKGKPTSEVTYFTCLKMLSET